MRAEGCQEDRSTEKARLVVKLCVVFLFVSLFTSAEPVSGDRGPGKPSACLGSGRTTDPVYPDTCLVLAWNYEEKENYRKAEEAYDTCLGSHKVPNKVKEKVEQRSTWLTLKIIKQEVDSLIDEWEKYKPIFETAQAPENSITVVPFVDLSGDELLRCWAPGIVGMLTEALHRVERLRLRERAHIIELKKERDWTDSSFMHRDTLREAGGILRVDKVITGTLDKSGGNDLEIKGVIYSRNAYSYYPVQRTTGELHRLLWLLREFTFAILRRLDITPTPQERREITKVFTESMEAFLAYCLGLKHLDEGEYAQAAEYFEKALRLDPDYGLAKKMVKQAHDLVGAGCEIDDFIPICLSTLVEVKEDKARSGRLKSSGQYSTGNFIPNDPNSPPEDKQKDAVAPVGTVIIRGTIR